MRIVAPGKLVLTGAYAVLEGAPAIVAAVDRYAVVDSSTPDEVDVRALHDGAGHKLGLGSSAASLVASHAARAVARGEDLRDADVRARILRDVRGAHAQSQGGGSGVDVAASVHGSVLHFVLDGDQASVRTVDLPAGIVLAAFWSGASARTSDLRARVDAHRARTADALGDLRRIASNAAAAVDAGDGASFVAAAAATARALDALGRAADAPIVLPAFAELASVAAQGSGAAAFLPSGAGGGDVAVWIGLGPPPQDLLARAAALGMRPLSLGVDRGGVRVQSPSP
jgi:phosphomevalonate kinase